MSKDKNLLAGSASLLVLSLLAQKDMYGYQMIAELEERMDRTFSMKEGTLYPILHGLENQGALKSYNQEAPSGKMRKYYHITKKGLSLLKEKTEEWNTFTEKVNAVIVSAGPLPELA